jgi:exodeoxyribonuclease-1
MPRRPPRFGRRLDGLWAQVFARPAEAAPPDVDEDLYGGFVGNDDRRVLQRLRELSPGALAGKHPAFQDPRLEELLFRYRARNFPDTLDDDEQQRWQQHRRARACTTGWAAGSR